MFGESRRDANSEPVLYGLLRDPTIDLDSPDNYDTSTADHGKGPCLFTYLLLRW